jgi:thiosulfate dehydrogenase [quinone] large subunit
MDGTTARGIAPRWYRELSAASASARGLLLVRLFFGITFVYAGLDKLLDADFFNPSAPTSIQAQFAIFERLSPLAPLVKLVEPLAIPLGVLIALGEIGAGLGALTALSFRLAALGGAGLSLMFYLTASWSTQPYYLGPDLPYAVGWLALAVAGHGGLWIPRWRFTRAPPVIAAAPPPGAVAPVETAVSDRLSRRQIIEFGALAGLTLIVGSLAGSLRLLLPERFAVTPTPTPRPTASPLPSSTAPVASGSAAPSVVGGIPVATIADVSQQGFLDIQVPISAPAALFPGDPAVIIKLGDGSFVCFDAICTHEGCTVGYNTGSAVLHCPCHGAEFDPTNHASVLQGPARLPLPELPLVVDTTAGTISLAVS